MDTHHPHFIWVYLADVDHAGHSGNWTEYINAITTADGIVGDLWRHLQNDPFYKDSTTLFITNDHGRHDDQHGGFQGHGCGCEGCRHIEFIAVGPSIKKGFVSNQVRNIPDMAVSASYLLGIDPEYSTGEVMHEIFNANAVNDTPNLMTLHGNDPNPFSKSTEIRFYLTKPSLIQLSIFDMTGREIITIEEEWKNQGDQSIEWDATNEHGEIVTPGIYFYSLHFEKQMETGKLLFIGK
ncbi:MAG: T9SS type A sorting domain-containing protein [Bacteroidales bacterium]|nr:T9SS type A sorting domain-containing protein [Bacteroidales bacterium]